MQYHVKAPFGRPGKWSRQLDSSRFINTAAVTLALVMLISSPGSAIAGSPFITDDPAFEKGWEIKLAAIYEKFSDEETLIAPLIDLNYAPTDHLQLNVTLAQRSQFVKDAADETGFSDTDLKVKWRFLDEQEDTWIPAISIAPAITVPTASESRGLGDGIWRSRVTAQIAKTFGPFYTYIESGVQLAFGDHDHALYGWVLQYQLAEKWSIGGELNGNMPLVGGDTHGLIGNLGMTYTLSDHCQLQASVGRTLRRESHGGPKLLLQLFVQWNY